MLKITDVSTVVLKAPLGERKVRMSFGHMDERSTLLVLVKTDSGLVGVGESWINFPSWGAEERVATIHHGLRPLLIGEDALNISGIWNRLWRNLNRLGLQWGALGPIYQATSGVDIALWDLVGKMLNVPLYKLLGGADSVHVPAYASGINPDNAEHDAVKAVEQGFSRIKLKVGFGRDVDMRNVAAIRRAVGDGVKIAVDANQAWSRSEARKMAGLLAEFDVEWLEEPIPCDDREGLKDLRRESSVPLAAGENTYGVKNFVQLLTDGAVDIIQPDVTKVGGLTEARTILHLARTYGVPFCPHFFGSAVGLAASAHLFASSPGGIAVEVDVNPNPLRERLLEEPLRIVDGELYLPDGPGLGVTLRAQTVDKYRVH